MQLDFHYYCTAVLARAAGFSQKDSETIAYACQYVDNATESEPIVIGKGFFEPVRTAHFGLFSFDWGTQKRVFIPFHFLPGKKGFSSEGIYNTLADSEFANELVDVAKKDTTDLRLLKLGIALHTYQDTWSHAPFSGRNHRENDCDRIDIHNKGILPVISEIEFNVLDFIEDRFNVDVGHLKVGVLPDIPFLNWTCKVGGSSKRFTPNRASEAARHVYAHLCAASDSAPLKSWGQLQPMIENAFQLVKWKLGVRCENWKSVYKQLFNVTLQDYNPLTWRMCALNVKNPKKVMWDTSSFVFSNVSFPGSEDIESTKWFQFHKAALAQRHYVLEEM